MPGIVVKRMTQLVDGLREYVVSDLHARPDAVHDLVTGQDFPFGVSEENEHFHRFVLDADRLAIFRDPIELRADAPVADHKVCVPGCHRNFDYGLVKTLILAVNRVN
jgi:hypothetical protein